VLWICDIPEHKQILQEILDALSPGQRSRLNTPIAARQRIKTVLDAREHGTEEKVKQTPLTLAKQQLAEQNRKIAHLEEQLAAAQNDASLFDLRRDSADHIIRVMTDPSTISEHKARTIATGILAGLKARSKPGGSSAPKPICSVGPIADGIESGIPWSRFCSLRHQPMKAEKAEMVATPALRQNAKRPFDRLPMDWIPLMSRQCNSLCHSSAAIESGPGPAPSRRDGGGPTPKGEQPLTRFVPLPVPFRCRSSAVASSVIKQLSRLLRRLNQIVA
jgi:hypothetical protein